MDSMTFVLFGATGDLAKRKIYPALYNLFVEGKIPASFSVIGMGRREVADEQFQSNVEQSIKDFSRHVNEDRAQMDQFLSAFRYSALNVNHPEDYKKLLQLAEQRENDLGIPGNRMFYLSVAPEFFDVIALNIRESGLAETKGWKRLIIEKPFGHDLESARELNDRLSRTFAEDEIYRIDHYLGKPMVQNLEALKFANPLLQGIWNNQYIANVQITASETVGVEERAGYYDHSGAIRDMVQNHMLQVLMMTAMNKPGHVTADQVRDEKSKVMDALRALDPSDIASNVVRGQYTNGEINGKAVPSYNEEPDIGPDSQNDTFISARLWIDNEQWSGVPFYIRTGKRMKEKSTRIVVEFKKDSTDPYAAQGQPTDPNLLIIHVNPDEKVTLRLNSRDPLNAGQLETVLMNYHSEAKDVPEAYERLIFDALRGDSTFFAHWNEVELSWVWVQPVLEAFARGEVPLHTYAAGSYGPEASDQLLEEQGFTWWLDEKSESTEKAVVRS
ncbi:MULTISPECIES: glucose-6-phosphate dehydrogenase [Paenibacillus]|jgi:glucose-6-phosphate 1-dehydrogenase|uniref:Glucose-6-phosphate 1-dehydrogenase n=2 Tax=Paenibacillus TaxID=44249 RepID=A0AAJ3J0R5_PAEPO|nr:MULTISPECIES: glucose-6-phosphate dehydrogenase [Paenibacillus]AHC19731.1 glucose-6-phosphate dehydrogenase [Paenibacillus polymyxa CR1]ALA41986.1 glucose-6-phosphate dehydrogenase [Paenibacillus peoriae]APB76284.1 glucose-6-phosphate dehydrogenase [Paenibacillus polymyxa]APQ59173.1 glucose-6-phosphate dehydrogenase [Paenibacillus polymyxa]MBP1175984.1 glucose-6-phosphate 1-dehydrogenase [Paenibacillus sp. PvR133]